MTEALTQIVWMADTVHMEQERRVEGSAIIYGYRLNGGEFKPTMRMECHDVKGLAEAKGALASLGYPVTP